MDEATMLLQQIRRRLQLDTAGFCRSADAWKEYSDRIKRWKRLCPPQHRTGVHLRLEDGTDHKSNTRLFGAEARQRTPELEAERFTHAGLPNHSVVVKGLRDVGDTTVTLKEFHELYG